MKVSELQGADLDYWVARAEGWEDDRPQDRQMKKRGIVPNAGYSQGYSRVLVGPRPERGMHLNNLACFWSPSTMWNVGGPIIERVGMLIRPHGWHGDKITLWAAFCYDWSRGENYGQTGETPLIAAMRSYVRSVYGDELPAHPAAQQQD